MSTQRLGYEQLLQLAVADGDTTPDPGVSGVHCYSTSDSAVKIWNGTSWESHAAKSNTVLTGTTLTLPASGYSIDAATNLTISSAFPTIASTSAGSSFTSSMMALTTNTNEQVFSIQGANNTGGGFAGSYMNAVVAPMRQTTGTQFSWGNLCVQSQPVGVAGVTKGYTLVQLFSANFGGPDAAGLNIISNDATGTFVSPGTQFVGNADGYDLADSSGSYNWYTINVNGTAYNQFPTHTFVGNAFDFKVSGTQTFSVPTTAGTSGYVLSTDGAGNTSWISSGSTPAGSNTQIQYNNSGAFGASSNFTWDNGSNTLQIGPSTSSTSNIKFYNLNLQTSAPSDPASGVNITANGFTINAAVDGSLVVATGVGGGYGQNFNLFPPITPATGSGLCHCNIVLQTKPSATGNVSGQHWIQLDTTYDPVSHNEAATINLGANAGSSGGTNYATIPMTVGVAGTNNVMLKYWPDSSAGNGFHFKTDLTVPLQVDVGQIKANVPVVFPTYTTTTLPTGIVGGQIFVSNANAGVGTMAFYNGTNWIDIKTGVTVSV